MCIRGVSKDQGRCLLVYEAYARSLPENSPPASALDLNNL